MTSRERLPLSSINHLRLIRKCITEQDNEVNFLKSATCESCLQSRMLRCAATFSII